MANLYKVLLILLAVTATSGCASTTTETPTVEQQRSVQVILPGSVDYIPLNPARGDNSPQAGVLWGNIRKDQASGVLLKFADGFSSPPHIHNITYRGVVISGALHNDDPGAAKQWMGPGSFWTQPAGEAHITAARPGSGATAFLEILDGPYLVQPVEEQFDNGERPLNLQSSNIVWLNAGDVEMISADVSWRPGPQIALLWRESGSGSLNGSLLKLPNNYSGQLYSNNGDLKSVVIQGDLAHTTVDQTETQVIGPGGYFASTKNLLHELTCISKTECTVYLRTDGKIRFVGAE